MRARITSRHVCLIAAGTGSLALSTMLVADLFTDQMLYRLGLVVMLLAATAYLAGRSTVCSDMMEHARQRGYDQGFREGREIARPVVVPLDSADSAVLYPARQFGQQLVRPEQRQDALAD